MLIIIVVIVVIIVISIWITHPITVRHRWVLNDWGCVIVLVIRDVGGVDIGLVTGVDVDVALGGEGLLWGKRVRVGVLVGNLQVVHVVGLIKELRGE